MANYRPGFQRSDTDFGKTDQIRDVEVQITQTSTTSDHSDSFGKSPTDVTNHLDQKPSNEKYIDTEAVPAYDDEEGETVGPMP